MDALILARIQFAANISFHILFPTITIALGWVLLFFKLRFNATRDESWMDAYKLLGEGLRPHLRAGRRLRHHDVLPVRHELAGLHEHGRQRRGPAARLRGPHGLLPGASFLGIMLFGYNRVSNRVHTLATVLVPAAPRCRRSGSSS
jgi:cytochrome d ubiquinol oxidase subunit I